LKFNFITRKNNTCQILNNEVKLGDSTVVECDKIEDIFRLETVWDEEPKALNSYLLMTEFNTDGTFTINIVLALSAWQLIQSSSL